MLFSLNLLNRYDNHKTTEKLDNTHNQLQKTRTQLSTMLNNTNQSIQTIDQRMKSMNGEIEIIRGDITLTQIVAGHAVQLKLKDLKKSGAEAKKEKDV